VEELVGEYEEVPEQRCPKVISSPGGKSRDAALDLKKDRGFKGRYGLN